MSSSDSRPAIPSRPPIDIEVLMERIRADVAERRRTATPASTDALGPPYAFGTVLVFRSGGNADPYIGNGWGGPEPQFRWTDGNFADVRFAFSEPVGSLLLSFNVAPHLGAEVSAQRVAASWNGTPIGDWVISEAGAYHTIFFPDLTGDSRGGTLRFHLPDAFSPASKRINPDPRRLGLGFFDLSLRPAGQTGLLSLRVAS